MNGQTVLPDVEHEATAATAPGFNQEISAGDDRYQNNLGSTTESPRATYPTRARADNNSALSVGDSGGGGRSLPSEPVPTGSGTVATSCKAGQSGASDTDAAVVASATSGAALRGGNPKPPSVVGQSSASVAVEGEDGGDRPDRCSTLSVSVLEQQEQPEEETGRRGGAHDRIEIAGGGLQNSDGAAGEGGAGLPPSSGTFGDRGLGLSGTESMDPRLKLTLPWEEARASAENSAAAGTNRSSGGGASARAVGGVGSAAAGLTYPGPRPLSAAPIRPGIGTTRLNATSPVLSGRRFEGASVCRDRELGRSLGRTAGVSLAGRLLSYATRPDGKFDVFAAARDGQVGKLQTLGMTPAQMLVVSYRLRKPIIKRGR